MASKEFENVVRTMAFSLINHGDKLDSHEKSILIQAIARKNLINGEENTLNDYYRENISKVTVLFERYTKENIYNNDEEKISFTDYCTKNDEHITSHKFWNVFGRYVKKFKRLPFLVEFLGFFVAIEYGCPYLREYFNLPSFDKKNNADDVFKLKRDIADIHDRYSKEKMVYVNKINSLKSEIRHLDIELCHRDAIINNAANEIALYKTYNIPYRHNGRTKNERLIRKEYGTKAIEVLWLFGHVKCKFTNDENDVIAVDKFYKKYKKFCYNVEKPTIPNGDSFIKLVVDMFKSYNIDIRYSDNDIGEIVGIKFNNK